MLRYFINTAKYTLADISSIHALSLTHIQVVDDEQQHTLVAASTLMPEIRGQLNGTGGANKVSLAAGMGYLVCI